MSSAFMPHGHCYLWTPSILWLHVGSDLVIAASYFLIPLALVALVRRRGDLVFDWMFLLFAAFIFGCGATHLFDVWNTWHSNYLGEGVVKALTAGVSAATAIAVWPLLPKALALRSPSQLEAENLLLERSVAERTRELQKSNENLRHFASFLSHELRQPLAALLNWSEVLDQELAESRSERPRQTLGRMRRSIGQMADLVTAELALAEVGTSAPTESVDLTAVVRDLVSDLAQPLLAAGATVEVGELGAVHAEPANMTQLFRNLLENAIKYRRTEVPLVVRIGARRVEIGAARAAFLEVRVADNGLGFDPERAREIFEMRRRVAPPEIPGAGVGLTICRRIAEASGGSIVATGEPGRGATFTVTLPAADPIPFYKAGRP
jgi:signal transduction histidine kinase